MEEIIEKYILGQLAWSQVLSIVFLVMLTVLGTQFISWAVKKCYLLWENSQLPNSHDETVWLKTRAIFSDRLLQFLRQHNFGQPFLREIPDSLLEAVEYKTLQTPDYLFLNKDLVKRQKVLLENIDTFSKDLLHITSYVENNFAYAAVPKETYRDNSSAYLDAVTKLNDSASSLIQAYDELNFEVNRLFNKKITKTPL